MGDPTPLPGQRPLPDLRPLGPSSGFRLTLLQMVLSLLFVGGAGYSVGMVHAQQQAHESQEGHPGLVKRVSQVELTQAKVAAVLERLERR